MSLRAKPQSSVGKYETNVIIQKLTPHPEHMQNFYGQNRHLIYNINRLCNIYVYIFT